MKASGCVEEKVGKSEAHFTILHCEVDKEARELGEKVKAKFNCVELVIAEAGR